METGEKKLMKKLLFGNLSRRSGGQEGSVAVATVSVGGLGEKVKVTPKSVMAQKAAAVAVHPTIEAAPATGPGKETEAPATEHKYKHRHGAKAKILNRVLRNNPSKLGLRKSPRKPIKVFLRQHINFSNNKSLRVSKKAWYKLNQELYNSVMVLLSAAKLNMSKKVILKEDHIVNVMKIIKMSQSVPKLEVDEHQLVQAIASRKRKHQ